MGQQQLLLLVLGIVLVGIAIVVGVNAYSENSVKTNWDNLLQDALRIANDAQQWKAKPELFGGSDDVIKATAENFTDLTFLELAYAPDLVGTTFLCYQNLNGTYVLNNPGVAGVTIEGYNASNQNYVEVFLDGNLESDIELNEDASIRGGQLISTGGPAPVVAPVCPLPVAVP